MSDGGVFFLLLLGGVAWLWVDARKRKVPPTRPQLPPPGWPAGVPFVQPTPPQRSVVGTTIKVIGTVIALPFVILLLLNALGSITG